MARATCLTRRNHDLIPRATSDQLFVTGRDRPTAEVASTTPKRTGDQNDSDVSGTNLRMSSGSPRVVPLLLGPPEPPPQAANLGYALYLIRGRRLHRRPSREQTLLLGLGPLSRRGREVRFRRGKEKPSAIGNGRRQADVVLMRPVPVLMLRLATPVGHEMFRRERRSR